MRQTLGIIGVGAFGEFMLRHIIPYFNVRVFDAHRDLTPVAARYNVEMADLDTVCACDIVIIAVPVRGMEDVIKAIAPKIRAGQLVMDVGSVKIKPTTWLNQYMPQGVDIIGLHPLFGPQSGKKGIAGLNVAIVNVRGDRAPCVTEFLADVLHLNVHPCTAEEHDHQMAYVQGLTHMIAKVFTRMDVPAIQQETKTFSLLRQMVDLIKDDSDALFRAIQKDNPYSTETVEKFFKTVKRLEDELQ